MSSMVILGLEIGIGTVLIPRMAVDRRAVLRRLGRLNRKPVLGELGVSAHVDARHVPVDGVTALGVLELQDVVLVRLGGQLDGNTAAVAVGLPGLGVGATVRREGLHFSSSIGDGPRVDVEPHVVDNFDAAVAGGGAVTGLDGTVGEGRSEGGQGGSDETELVEEHHFVCVVVVERKRKACSKKIDKKVVVKDETRSRKRV